MSDNWKYLTTDGHGHDDMTIADGLFSIADAIDALASAVREAGAGGQYGPGALEFIGMQLRDGVKIDLDLSEIATAIEELRNDD